MAEVGDGVKHVSFGMMRLSGAEDLETKRGAATRTLGDFLSLNAFAKLAATDEEVEATVAEQNQEPEASVMDKFMITPWPSTPRLPPWTKS